MKCFSDFAKVLKKATFNKNNERFFNDLFYAVTDYNSEEDDNPIEKEDDCMNIDLVTKELRDTIKNEWEKIEVFSKYNDDSDNCNYLLNVDIDKNRNWI